MSQTNIKSVNYTPITTKVETQQGMSTTMKIIIGIVIFVVLLLLLFLLSTYSKPYTFKTKDLTSLNNMVFINEDSIVHLTVGDALTIDYYKRPNLDLINQTLSFNDEEITITTRNNTRTFSGSNAKGESFTFTDNSTSRGDQDLSGNITFEFTDATTTPTTHTYEGRTYPFSLKQVREKIYDSLEQVVQDEISNIKEMTDEDLYAYLEDKGYNETQINAIIKLRNMSPAERRNVALLKKLVDGRNLKQLFLSNRSKRVDRRRTDRQQGRPNQTPMYRLGALPEEEQQFGALLSKLKQLVVPNTYINKDTITQTILTYMTNNAPGRAERQQAINDFVKSADGEDLTADFAVINNAITTKNKEGVDEAITTIVDELVTAINTKNTTVKDYLKERGPVTKKQAIVYSKLNTPREPFKFNATTTKDGRDGKQVIKDTLNSVYTSVAGVLSRK